MELGNLKNLQELLELRKTVTLAEEAEEEAVQPQTGNRFS